jgi:ABC-2 type transport system ATP-binding protein
LFVEYLREYAADGKTTIFLTSHIIQDMEMLIDDCIILDYGRILLHEPTSYILDRFRRYRFASPAPAIGEVEGLWNTGRAGEGWETYSFLPAEEVERRLAPHAASGLRAERLSLEDAFIGLTGKY